MASLPEHPFTIGIQAKLPSELFFLYTRTIFGLYVADNLPFGKTTAADRN
jgi:hypothetical protein